MVEAKQVDASKALESALGVLTRLRAGDCEYSHLLFLIDHGVRRGRFKLSELGTDEAELASLRRKGAVLMAAWQRNHLELASLPADQALFSRRMQEELAIVSSI